MHPALASENYDDDDDDDEVTRQTGLSVKSKGSV